MTEAFLLEKASNFVDMGLWPPLSELNPRRWLDNFTDDERPLAIHLLNAFTHLSEPITRELFKAAFHSLSSHFYRDGATYLAARNAWRHFRNTAVVTYVTGEQPNPADSGYMFARYARDILKFDPEQILDPGEVVQRLGAGASLPLVVVDDFAGSGDQFLKWWKRPFNGLPAGRNSLATVAGSKRDVFFCVSVATAYAKGRIAEMAPNVVLVPGSLLPNENSAFDQASNVWPIAMRLDGIAMVEAASRRVGIPDTDGGDNDWRGFHKLGLCLTFSHSTPDATLPIFTWDRDGWHPLFRRR